MKHLSHIAAAIIVIGTVGPARADHAGAPERACLPIKDMPSSLAPTTIMSRLLLWPRQPELGR